MYLVDGFYIMKKFISFIALTALFSTGAFAGVTQPGSFPVIPKSASFNLQNDSSHAIIEQTLTSLPDARGEVKFDSKTTERELPQTIYHGNNFGIMGSIKASTGQDYGAMMSVSIDQQNYYLFFKVIKHELTSSYECGFSGTAPRESKPTAPRYFIRNQALKRCIK
ncbi:hypothetical protein [Dongshaea marina]|uniref:hypothetical protein n=1 Tax=Dongshaea marina TaxID=2047966 RepID=UPI000D3E18F6|nr:hypothetical protein [Dongshaea marina]